MRFFHGQPPLVKIPSHNLRSRKSTWVCLKMGYRVCVYIYTPLNGCLNREHDCNPMERK